MISLLLAGLRFPFSFVSIALVFMYVRFRVLALSKFIRCIYELKRLFL